MLLHFFKNFPVKLDFLRSYSKIFQESPWKLAWDSVIIAVSMLTAIVSPLTIMFHIPGAGKFLYFDLLVTLVFFIDILINIQGDNKIKIIAKNGTEKRKYLSGWFFLDLLAMIPFDIILSFLGLISVYPVLRILRLLRIIKLFRLAQFMHKIRISNLVNPSFLRLFFLAFWIIFVAHFISCGWLLMDNLAGKTDNLTRYIQALYWTVTTLTTIGYGDITPSNNTQTIFVMFIEILGAGMYGFVIANIATLIANIDIAKSQHREKLEKINTFMKYRNIPPDLQLRINDYYSYSWESRKGYDESEVLADLPIALKTDVSMHLSQEIIEKVPIFAEASIDLIREIILNLKPVIYMPGDFVFQKGDVGLDMFFISKGSIEVVSEDGKTIYANLSSGHFFGEIALLLSQPRTASIRAADYCDLYRLKKEDFDRVLKNFPDFNKRISELARKRQAEISSSANST